ncbi:extensin family protein [Xanthobacter sp. VNH20]|uniref:extensin-like domain-containing protein n=1 Tax=Xanthobacter sp. VNH20 TaxID=3156616 RepID=UPI0032B44ADD
MRSARLVGLAWTAGVVMIAGPHLAIAQERPVTPPVGVAAPFPIPAPQKYATSRPTPAVPPLPLPRPRDQEPAGDASATSDAKGTDPGDAALTTCLTELAARGGEALPVASEDTREATGACAIPGAVTFSRVDAAGARPVSLDSAVTIRCTLALEVTTWIREDLAPIAKRHGADLAQLTGVGGYACRPRNGQAGAQISEHASGNALDLLGLRLTDGRVIELSSTDPATRTIREDIRASACARFLTVLGPGADSAHKNHVHLDMRRRRGDFRMCQWDVK